MMTVNFLFFTSQIPSLVRPVWVWWTTSFFEPRPPVATHPKLSCAQRTPHPNVHSSPCPWWHLRHSSVLNPCGSLTTRARQLSSHSNGRSLIRREQTLPTHIYRLGGMVWNSGSDPPFITASHVTAHHAHTCLCMCVFMNITLWLSSQGNTFWAKALANTETAAETASSFTLRTTSCINPATRTPLSELWSGVFHSFICQVCAHTRAEWNFLSLLAEIRQL